jgi:metallophosphoesterase superfamily enzyme
MALSEPAARGDGCARITWGGEQLVLWPQKALSWPRTRTLLVADAHFGKDAHFRVSGIPCRPARARRTSSASTR